jgi:hypothetical protein
MGLWRDERAADMRKILDQIERIKDMLFERSEQVADGTVALTDRHHVAQSMPAGLLDAVVELDRLSWERGHEIRDKARLHVNPLSVPVMRGGQLSPEDHDRILRAPQTLEFQPDVVQQEARPQFPRVETVRASEIEPIARGATGPKK